MNRENINISSLTEKEKKRIIKIGKANDRLNKHTINVTLPPVLLGALLIIIYGFGLWEEISVIIAGMALLFGGCCISLVWFISLSIRATNCKNYSYSLYKELVKTDMAEEICTNEEMDNLQPLDLHKSDKNACDDNIMPRTHKLASEHFDGDIKKAVEHVMLYVRGEELDEYMKEWTPEMADHALTSVYNFGKEKFGEKGIKQIMNIESTLENLNLTEEEVLTRKNPFVKKSLKSVFILLFGCIGIPILLAILKEYIVIDSVEGWILGALSIFITYQAFGIANNLINIFRFKRVKRSILQMQELSEEVETRNLNTASNS